ncbi:MAG: C40 family peptidase [Candidatus Hydrothermia bacterium]|jgi:cell wall-associated NlpC family hydrolase|nr:C40 family peptidase [Candidatus Hydrothermia bacterium]
MIVIFSLLSIDTLHPFYYVSFKFVGTKYKYGGIDDDGMDCSGFVYKVLSEFGIKAPRTSKDYINFGSFVQIDSIKPGDILIFSFYSPYDHVGIYIGDNKVIHSASKKGVIIEDMKYIKSYLKMARRITLFY